MEQRENTALARNGVTSAADDQPSRDALHGAIASGVIWKLTSQGFLQITRTIVAIVLARLLTPEDYGVAGIALLLSGYVLVFSDLALGAALIQRKTLAEVDRSTSFWASVASGLCLTIIGIALAAPVAAFFGEPEVRDLFMVVSLMFVLSSLDATQRALLTRDMNFKSLEIRVILATAVSAIAAIALAVEGFGAWAIVAQQVIFVVCSTIFIWIVCPWRPHFMFSAASFRSMFRFSSSVLGSRFLYSSEEATTNALIARLIGPSALGIFAISTNVVLSPLSRISIPVAEVLFPAFSRIQDDSRRIGDVWTSSLRYVAVVAMPALTGLAIVAPELVVVVLGKRWSEAVPILRLLAPVGIMRALQAWTTSIVMAVGRADVLFWISLDPLGVWIFSIVVGSSGGLVGVAALYASISLVGTFFWMRYVASLIDLSIGAVLRPLKGVTAATAVMAVGVILAGSSSQARPGRRGGPRDRNRARRHILCLGSRRLAPKEYERVLTTARARRYVMRQPRIGRRTTLLSVASEGTTLDNALRWRSLSAAGAWA